MVRKRVECIFICDACDDRAEVEHMGSLPMGWHTVEVVTGPKMGDFIQRHFCSKECLCDYASWDGEEKGD